MYFTFQNRAKTADNSAPWVRFDHPPLALNNDNNNKYDSGVLDLERHFHVSPRHVHFKNGAENSWHLSTLGMQWPLSAALNNNNKYDDNDSGVLDLERHFSREP